MSLIVIFSSIWPFSNSDAVPASPSSQTCGHLDFFATHLSPLSSQSPLFSGSKQLWCEATIMCSIVPCLPDAMWPKESEQVDHTLKHLAHCQNWWHPFIFTEISWAAQWTMHPKEVRQTVSARSSSSSYFAPHLMTCWLSSELYVKQQKMSCSVICDSFKRSETAVWKLRHSIPLAQTAPEIGSVFVRRSITEMQPPPSAPPSEALVVCGVSEVTDLWLESLLNLFRNGGNMMSLSVLHSQ